MSPDPTKVTRRIVVRDSNGNPTVEERVENLTPAEINAARQANVRAQLEQATQAALDINRAFLALGTPTATQVGAHVKALTRQNVALIRLMVGMLDAVD